MKTDDLTTEEAITTFSITEKYIKTLKWTIGTDDYTKTLVIGNIRGFFMWLYNNDFIVHEMKKILAITDVNLSPEYSESLEYLKGCYPEPSQSDVSVTQDVLMDIKKAENNE